MAVIKRENGSGIKNLDEAKAKLKLSDEALAEINGAGEGWCQLSDGGIDATTDEWQQGVFNTIVLYRGEMCEVTEVTFVGHTFTECKLININTGAEYHNVPADAVLVNYYD